MDERQDVTVPMPTELVEEIANELDYGDSRAEWIREACRMKLEAERSGEADGEADAHETDGGIDVDSAAIAD